MSIRCPVCNGGDPLPFHEDSLRRYYQCKNCGLVFVPEAYHLSRRQEKNRYELHENHPDNQGYRRFLRRFFTPMNKRIVNHSEGLDFGAGPGPTLHLMFEEAGHTMEIYDKFFAQNATVFDKKYDFICATEVAEHLCRPMTELNLLWKCLKPGGFLGLMTKMVRSRSAFKKWHYIRDQTHISFFSKKTFRWLSNRWGAHLDFITHDIIFFQK